MGNRCSLVIGDHCEIEANNCVPVTWLALFTPSDFVVKRYEEDGRPCEAAGYITTCGRAQDRAAKFVARIKGRTPVWRFLRPLETLENELRKWPPETQVRLEATEMWFFDKRMQDNTKNAAGAFEKFVGKLSGNESGDLASLNKVIQDNSPWRERPVEGLSSEDKMFLLFGMYFGEPESEARYSLELFGDAYWSPESA